MGWFGISRLENLLDILGMEPANNDAGIVYRNIKQSSYVSKLKPIIEEIVDEKIKDLNKDQNKAQSKE